MFNTVEGTHYISLDFSFVDSHQNLVLGKGFYLTDGLLQLYDGISVVEAGFNYYPTIISATPLNASGTIANGVYTYYALYSWIDNNGEIQRSAPSTGTVVKIGRAHV